ncbi:MAG: hypothetical protein ACLFPF_05090 [Halanaerobiales bacterium]
MSDKLGKARLLEDKSEIPCNNPWFAEKYPDDLLIGLQGSKLPDERDTVIVLEYIE